MFKLYPLISRFVVFLFLPIGALIAVGWTHVSSSLPQTSGQISVKGVLKPAKIYRDELGVVNIMAEQDQDVFFAVGYAHAQDRLWQLEIQKRTAQGRLSEIFGRASVNNDVWIRTLGLYPAAEQAWEHLDEKAKASLIAYANGINAFLAAGSVLPQEFQLLGIKPEPWTPVDSLAWVKVFALSLSNNMWQEIELLAASQTLKPTQVDTFFPHYPANAPVTVTNQEWFKQSQLSSLYSTKGDLQTRLGIGGKNAGSNGWVVSGKLSETGQAILANDPHLALQIPSSWYAVSLNGDRLAVAGMSMVGLPIVVFGKNQDIAWGGTNMMADVQDLFVERINPANPAEYQIDGQWQKFDTRTEVIHVRREQPEFMHRALEPVEITVRKTKRGPIISDTIDRFEYPISLKWTALKPEDTTYEAFFKLNYAQNWQDFLSALSANVAPTMNVLYIDVHNNIGFLATGDIPVRNKGDGRLPVEGWDQLNEWKGIIPKKDMPYSFNPEKGFIVSANNKIIGDSYPYFVSYDWASPERAERIEALLMDKSAKKKLNVQDMKNIQMDTVDLSTVELSKLLLRVRTTTNDQKKALDHLKFWSGSMDQTSVAAAIFFSWTEHLKRQLFDDELKASWNRPEISHELTNLRSNMTNRQLALVLEDKTQLFCDKVDTAVVETCEQVMLMSLNAAISELTKLSGDDMADWQWGNVHQAVFAHQPFSEFNVLKHIFGRTIKTGGAPNTVNVANARFELSKGYIQDFGAGFRQVMQAGATGQHWFNNSTGQSGNVLSPHYDDMLQSFHRAEFYTLKQNASEPHWSMLTLVPAPTQTGISP